MSETKITGNGNSTNDSGFLGNGVFQDAVSLNDVTLPSGLIAIPAATFADTTELKTIKIPNTVNRINAGNNDIKGAFEGSGLESIDLSGTGIIGGNISPGSPGAWPNADGSNNRGTFSKMPNLTTVTLPAGLTGIPKDAFANSEKLATVKFGAASANNGGDTPSARTVIGYDNTITLPTGLTSLGDNAFTSAVATAVDLSKATGLTTINDYVFKDMPNLTTVTLPSGLTRINTSAFQDDAKLTTLSQANPAAQTRDQDITAPTTGIAKFGSKLTSIGNNAFQGTGFSTVDLSAATGTLASGGSGSTGTQTLSVGTGAFTNMAALTTVKLPATTTNINPASFGTKTSATQAWTIQYGGENTTLATITLSDQTISSPNFSKIKNQTIEIKSTTTSAINFNGGVFNGNSTMTKLKLNVTATNSTASLWNFNLGTAPTPGGDTTEAYKTAPLGNNENLTNIEFSGLVNQAGSSDANSNQFTKINDTTWSQVASIMNMFSSGTKANEKATNLAVWTPGTTGANSWISENLTGGENATVKTGWGDTGSTTLAQDTTSATKTHNGVKWTYNNDNTTGGAAAGKTNKITITGTGINIYKAMSGSIGYQTYIKSTTGARADDGITVTITLVPASAQQPSRRSTR